MTTRKSPKNKADTSQGEAVSASDEQEREIKDVNRMLGRAIRELRTTRQLSLRDVADATELSVSFLSLVERGKSSLALTSLQRVAEALGTDVPSLFPSGFAHATGAGMPHVQRADDEESFTIANSQKTYRLLSGRAPGRVLEPILETIQPSSSIEDPYGHDGEEFTYVLEGHIVKIIGGVEYELGPGDSIHYPSHLPHTVINRTDKRARTLHVVTPRFF